MKEAKETLGLVGLAFSLIPAATLVAVKCGVRFAGAFQYAFAGVNVFCLLTALLLCAVLAHKNETRTGPAVAGLCISAFLLCAGLVLVGVGAYAGSKLGVQ